jgi:hypothetical protein
MLYVAQNGAMYFPGASRRPTGRGRRRCVSVSNDQIDPVLCENRRNEVHSASRGLSTMPRGRVVSQRALTNMHSWPPGAAWALAWMQGDACSRRAAVVGVSCGRSGVPCGPCRVRSCRDPPARGAPQYVYDARTWTKWGRTNEAARDFQNDFFVYWAIAAVVVFRSLRWRWRPQAWMGILYIA